MRWPALLVVILLISLSLAAGSVRAESTMTIAGKVTDVDGQPFPGVTVTIRNTTTDQTQIVTTDPNGRYSYTTALGNYSVTATYTAYRANTSYTNVDRSRSDVDFEMYEVLGTVTGQVTDGNTTLAGVTVTLTGVNASFSGVSTAPLGAYRIENVTPGTYMVSASKEGYNTSYYSELVTLEKGSVETILFTLTETAVKYGKLSGRVTYNGDALSGVKVVLTPEEGADLVTATDATGNYSFERVPPGEYTITLTKDGYVTTEKKVVMEPQNSWVQDFSMKRSTLPGNSGFLMDYDLPHSLMIVGLGVSLLITLSSLVLRHRIRTNPELLEKEEETAPAKE